MVPLGSNPGSTAYGISGNGQIIVGDDGANAFIWDSVNGMQSLASVLENTYGLDLSGWTLGTAYAISNDGSTIVGYGTRPGGKTEAWVAVIPEPASSLLVLLGLAAISTRRFLRG
jgi:uncharacterized membrane protein